jgi:hypothetical protein
MVSAIIASLLSGAVAQAGPWAGDQAHACATEASVVRRARGIIRCILNGLLSIVAGFVWRVEGGGGETTKDDAADRMDVVGDGVTCLAHQGVTCNPPHTKSHLSISLCLLKAQSGPSVHMKENNTGIIAYCCNRTPNAVTPYGIDLSAFRLPAPFSSSLML